MTLHKTYLVPAEEYVRSRPVLQTVKRLPNVKNKLVANRGTVGKQQPHYKWVAFRAILREAAINESDLIHNFADFLCKVLPEAAPQHPSKTEQQPTVIAINVAETPLVSDAVTKRCLSSDSGGVDVETSSPYVDDACDVYKVSRSYLNEMRFLDEQYGTRRVGHSHMIGNSVVRTDGTGDISTGGKRFKGTCGLWEHLTR